MNFRDRQSNKEANQIFKRLRNTPNFEKELDFSLGPGTKDIYRTHFKRMNIDNSNLSIICKKLGLTLDEKEVLETLGSQAANIGSSKEWDNWRRIVNDENEKVILKGKYKRVRKATKQKTQTLTLF